MRAALYHRCSTLDQNPAVAREELQAAAARLGAEVTLDVEETGSGARNDRPGLQQLMEAARRGKLDVVLVWKLDRFGRSALDILANIRDLDAAGVRFIATTQGIGHPARRGRHEPPHPGRAGVSGGVRARLDP